LEYLVYDETPYHMYISAVFQLPDDFFKEGFGVLSGTAGRLDDKLVSLQTVDTAVRSAQELKLPAEAVEDIVSKAVTEFVDNFTEMVQVDEKRGAVFILGIQVSYILNPYEGASWTSVPPAVYQSYSL